MNQPDDIRKIVSKSYTSAVEQTKATSGACCSGPAPEGVLLCKATRLHWGLPAPAAVRGSEPDRLNAFRSTGDQLRRRLEVFLAGKDEGDHS